MGAVEKEGRWGVGHKKQEWREKVGLTFKRTIKKSKKAQTKWGLARRTKRKLRLVIDDRLQHGRWTGRHRTRSKISGSSRVNKWGKAIISA